MSPRASVVSPVPPCPTTTVFRAAERILPAESVSVVGPEPAVKTPVNVPATPTNDPTEVIRERIVVPSLARRLRKFPGVVAFWTMAMPTPEAGGRSWNKPEVEPRSVGLLRRRLPPGVTVNLSPGDPPLEVISNAFAVVLAARRMAHGTLVVVRLFSVKACVLSVAVVIYAIFVLRSWKKDAARVGPKTLPLFDTTHAPCAKLAEPSTAMLVMLVPSFCKSRKFPPLPCRLIRSPVPPVLKVVLAVAVDSLISNVPKDVEPVPEKRGPVSLWAGAEAAGVAEAINGDENV